MREGSGRMGKNLLLLAIASALGYAHLHLRAIHGAVPLAIAGIVVLDAVMIAAYARTPWAAFANAAGPSQTSAP